MPCRTDSSAQHWPPATICNQLGLYNKQKKDCFLSLAVDDILSCSNKILLR